jgi:ankyrin repeat protein
MEADLLFEAINDNQILTVKDMIVKNKMLLSERNERLQTPLHVAIGMEKTKLIKFLLEAGADIHTKDLNGNSCY